MEVWGNSLSTEAAALSHMAASLMEAVAVEMVVVAQKSLCLVLAMSSLFNGINFLDHQGGANQGIDDCVAFGLNQKDGRHVGDGVTPESNQVPPENKEDGDTDDDDEDDEEEDDDGEGDEDDVSENQDNNQGDEDPEDVVEANGEGGSGEGEEEDEDEDDDDDDEDGEEEDEKEEEEEEDEEDEEIPEPPAKKRK